MKITNIQFYIENQSKTELFLDSVIALFKIKLGKDIQLNNLDDYNNLMGENEVDIYYQIEIENSKNPFNTVIRLLLQNENIKKAFDYFDFINEILLLTKEQVMIPVGNTSYDYLLFDSGSKYFQVEESGSNENGGILFYSKLELSLLAVKKIINSNYDLR